jgi:serine/threonine-protein kinase
VTVAAEDYLGTPVEEARAELVALGLQVEIEPVTSADVAEGTVVAVDPTGEVPLDGVVTLGYALAPAPESEPEGEGGGNGNEGGGNGGEGNGNQGNQGNGNGNDKEDD